MRDMNLMIADAPATGIANKPMVVNCIAYRKLDCPEIEISSRHTEARSKPR